MSSKNYKETRKLQVKLTEAGLLEVGEQLAKAEQALDVVLEDKKEANAEFTETINDFKKQIKEFSEKITTGEEERSVECTVHIYPQSNRKEVQRNDTEEVIAKEDLTPDDLQGELNFAETNE